MTINRFIRRCFNFIGADIVRLQNSPDRTLIGLASRKFDHIIDVGANTGQFARRISHHFPASRIFCFEPLPAAFYELAHWADTQQGRVICFNCALGDSVCETSMHYHENHSPSSSLLASTPHGHSIYPQTVGERIIPVHVSTLDAHFADEKYPLSQNTLLKLDVQGYEDRVLRGGTHVLSKVDACILEVSLDSLYESQAQFNHLVSLLDTASFRYAGNLEQAYGSDGRVVYFDAVFIKRYD